MGDELPALIFLAKSLIGLAGKGSPPVGSVRGDG
jgi:hypothetical protein